MVVRALGVGVLGAELEDYSVYDLLFMRAEEFAHGTYVDRHI